MGMSLQIPLKETGSVGWFFLGVIPFHIPCISRTTFRLVLKLVAYSDYGESDSPALVFVKETKRKPIILCLATPACFTGVLSVALSSQGPLQAFNTSDDRRAARSHRPGGTGVAWLPFAWAPFPGSVETKGEAIFFFLPK